MHIAQVPRRFVTSHWGGTETVILETSKRLLQMGHRTEIICPNALARRDAEEIDTVPVTRVPYFYPYLGLNAQTRLQLDLKGGSLFSFHLMKALVDLPRLDLIHLHTGRRAGAIGRYVARKRNIPYLISLHGGIYDVPREEARSLREPTRHTLEWGKVLGWWVGARRVLEDAAGIVCVGRQEWEEVRRHFPGKRVELLENGVDAARFAQGNGASFRKRFRVPADARVLLTMGRIDPQKNQRLMLRVLSELLHDDPRVHVLLIGHVTSDPYMEQLLQDVREGDASRVTIIRGLDGASQDLVDAYHAADVFVLPSLHEPFGIVILEAWAAGLPVVASRVGGVPGFACDGQDALLCPSGNVGAFVHAIRTLLEDAPFARTIAGAGQRKARDNFGWDRVTRRLVGIYEDVRHESAVRK